MGFVTLHDGTVVHASQLTPNPVIGIRDGKSWTDGNVRYSESIYRHKDGTEHIVTNSYTIPIIIGN